MSEDRFYMPVSVFFGRDVISAHAKDLKKMGTKALIVTGRHSARKCGVYDDICNALDACGISYALFDKVEENPSAATIMKARDFGIAEQADFVIGAGGGSPMDAAKAIALMIRHAEEGRDYLYAAGTDSSAIPVVCIPTTCGTGSEVTAVSVLTDEVNHIKKSIPHKIFPRLALIDGKYLRSAGPSTLCNTAFDALSHLYESYLNADATILSKMIVKDGLREWKKCLPVLKGERTPEDQDFDTLMRAAMLGGLAIAHTGTSLPHALSYTLTCDLNVPHGKAVCYFLAGYLKEADPEEVSGMLELSGFMSVDDFHEAYLKCCKDLELEDEILDQALETTCAEVAANPAKCAKAPFAADPEVVRRVTFWAKNNSRNLSGEKSGSENGFNKDSRRFKAVLFDLDGTINDSGPGIINSICYSLEKMQLPVPGIETLRKFVGPSLVYSYRTYCGMNDEQAQKAVELYRECYHAGECYNLFLYEGIRELLADLKKAGIRCAVVTSKPQKTSEQILDHFDMTQYFDAIAGPDPDDPSNKKSALILRALKELGLDAKDVVMVGDSRFDIIGAKEAGCASIGVTYGYGTKEELVENGADYLADTPAGIREPVGLTTNGRC